MLNLLSFLRDGYENVVNRIGGRGSRLAAGTYANFGQVGASAPTDFLEAVGAYRSSFFRKVVDIPPEDMTREWRHWQAEKDQITAIEDEERRLGVLPAVRQAMKWARLYGGAGIVLGVNDGQGADMPLDLERVGKGGLQFIHAMSRNVLTAGEVDRNPLSPTFGLPKYYTIAATTGQQQIHPTRVLRFIGNELPDPVSNGEGWGDSLWMVLQRAVSSADLALTGVAELVAEAKTDIVSVPDLMTNLATKESEDKLVKRIDLASRMKGMNSTLILDAAEEWQQKQINFSGLPDIVKIFLAVLSGMADIPATRMLGKSPDGQNATGDSDLRNYYDMLRSRQINELGPAINPLDECLLRSSLGSRPKEIVYEWAPLWQLTPTEKAEVDNKTADTIAKLANTGLIPDSAMAKGAQNKVVEDGILPGMDQALADAEKANELPSALTEPSPGEIAMAGLAVKAGQPPNPANSNKPPPKGKPSARAVNDSLPRSLYVRRDVLNKADIAAWAKSQGIESIVSDPHVTLAFSREPVDWQKMGSADDWGANPDGTLTVQAGGPRSVEPLGPKGALVLMFASSNLAWRWWSMKSRGAAWEYGDDYQPHVTLTYEETGLDWRKIVPYRGKIELGPEIFEEVADDWSAGIVEEET